VVEREQEGMAVLVLVAVLLVHLVVGAQHALVADDALSLGDGLGGEHAIAMDGRKAGGDLLLGHCLDPYDGESAGLWPIPPATRGRPAPRPGRRRARTRSSRAPCPGRTRPGTRASNRATRATRRRWRRSPAASAAAAAGPRCPAAPRRVRPAGGLEARAGQRVQFRS